MRRYSFDDTSYNTNNHNNNNNYNENNINNHNSIINNGNKHHSSSNIAYESPSTSPRITNDTKGNIIYYYY